MTRFAVIAPPYPSHFQALQALCAVLVERGHSVVFVQQQEAVRWLDDPRLGFYGVGLRAFPEGSLEHALRLAANPGNPWQLHRLIRHLALECDMLCEQLPAAFRHLQVDAVICDEMTPAGALVAEALGLPFISVACALPINREPGIPLPVVPFAYGTDARSQRLQDGSEQVHDWLMSPVSKVLEAACRAHRLPPRRGLHEYLSPLAQLSQTLTGFDFPRHALPAHFHAVGPLRALQAAQQGHWPVAPERALVFASLGTLQGHRFELFARIARACRWLDAQLLVAHCGGLDAAQQARLLQLGAAFVTDFAPQQWAVRRADVVISHGGLNTVMDAVVAGTPLLVLPIAFDQPGVAARVVHHGLGLSLSHRAGVNRIATALADLLHNPRPGFAALQDELTQAGGVTRAADLVELAITQEVRACAMI